MLKMKKFIDIDYVSWAGKERKQKEPKDDGFIPGSSADPSDTNQNKRTWHILQTVIDEQITVLILSWHFLSSCVQFSFSLALILQNYLYSIEKFSQSQCHEMPHADRPWGTLKHFLLSVHSLNGQSAQESPCMIPAETWYTSINISNLHKDTSPTTKAA